MAVFRVERTQNFTVMSNHHLRDKNLSLKAKGLLSQMLSLPEDWDYTLSGLAHINQEGKDAIRAAIAELEKAGYVQRRQTMDAKGKFSTNEYIIREAPVSQEPSLENPLSENPTTDSPMAEIPATDSPATKNPTKIKKEKRSIDNKLTDLPKTDSLPFLSRSSSDAEGTNRKEPDWHCGRSINRAEMDRWRVQIRGNIGYADFTRENPYDTGQLDELVEIMVDAVCSTKETIRVSGNELPQEVVKSRLLKLNREHIQFVFECLRENTTKVRNIKQYLLAVLYNAPITMENGYSIQVCHNIY